MTNSAARSTVATALALLATGCTPGTPSGASLMLGPTTQQAHAPPALSGGTLLVLRDGHTALASDPEGDAVYAVDLDSRTVRWRFALQAGDEPGRLAEDGHGHAFVALRRGGAVVSMDVTTGSLQSRRAVCSAPRGIAYDTAHDALRVACAGGELATLSATGGNDVTVATVRDDLRDVVFDGTSLVATTFRAAELVRFDDGQPVPTRIARAITAPEDRVTGASATTGEPTHASITYESEVAWRTVALPGGGVAMLHQRAQSSSVAAGQFAADTSGWGSAASCTACSCSVVHSLISTMRAGDTMPHPGPDIPMATLPVDLAVSNDGQQFAVVSGANFSVPRLPEVLVLDAHTATEGTACADATRSARPAEGQATSAAFDPGGRLLVQTRAPATLWFEDTHRAIVLDATDRRDTGHDLFHANSGTFVACASCHPEGGDDGHVWTFDTVADRRRTMSLRGGLLATAPFHWRGEMPDLGTLMNDVFVSRMGAPTPAAAQVAALGHWIDALPLPVAPSEPDAAAVQRGQALFDDPSVGCATCHAGPLRTNNATVDVGTGGALQVPSLRGVRWRAPYMHDGCARTLADRFDATCGGRAHGHTAQLNASQTGDLVAYLESL